MGYIFETKKGTLLPASFYTGEEMQICYQHMQELRIVMNKNLNDAVVDSVEQWLSKQP